MKNTPFIFAVSGVKNSGKTTLITKLIPLLTEQGLNVATVKHDGHDFEPDVPGTDSCAHLKAGAYGSAVFSKNRFMLVKNRPSITEVELISAFPEADIIILEGFKHSSYPKIELVRSGNSSEPVCDPCSLIAIASDFSPSNPAGVPIIDINDPVAAAETLLACRAAGENISLIVLAGGRSSRMGTDKADLIYKDSSFLENQISKGSMLGIRDIAISGYQGDNCSERVIPDIHPGNGPLGGLENTLRSINYNRALVLSVDVPQVPLFALVHLINAAKAQDIPAAILRHNGKSEPLIGVYDAALADEMLAEITQRNGSVFALLRRVGYAVFDCDANDKWIESINDKEAYSELIRRYAKKR